MFEIRMPKFGLSMEEGTITKWYKKVGDFVKKGEPLVEVESEKIINTLESPFEGILKVIKVNEGETAKVGEIIGLIGSEDETIKEITEEKRVITSEESKVRKLTESKIGEEKSEEVILASPAAKRLAKEYGVDLSNIKGTGPSGRIVENDVIAFVEKMKQTKPVSKKIPLDPVRKRIMDNLVKSYKESVLVTNITKIDLTNLISFKKEFPDITLTAFFVKIVSNVLKDFPKFNAHFDGNELEIFDAINIGVAFDTANGLIVPVIRNVQEKSLKEIAQELQTLKAKVEENSLNVDDLTGSTFTITNLGMMRTDMFTPVLNGKEVAILGIGRTLKEPTVAEDKVVVRDFAYFSLSYDHRVIDGADAARFLGKLAEYFELTDNFQKINKI
ncbi:dihydrolipoamide acetyltransferase family protein [Caldisericum exile]|uniref:Dihydrolipoamide acetyltransferase component of pyruvate dehydrogenase complex n=1 Tax=Caldisericum exile (strain DSM 21853 / NBRC 104410 / AZM16c01) TaxID=511051 RepID=A0A7U6JE28_CALEA|nr:dihydrolipoamide acetyltransferase family protein [Caldisericum exile]BAL80301.1 acetoin dehydrogenase E2 component [Caldisericum exile AZM16c01]